MTKFELSARDSPPVENGTGMKKVSKQPEKSQVDLSSDEDDMLPEYDFSKMVRANYHRRFHEGDRVQINGAPFRVSGRDFVPEAEYKLPDKPSG